MQIIDYKIGAIVCSIKNPKKNIKRFIETKLIELTGMSWQVTIEDEGGRESLNDLQNQLYQEVYDEFKKLPGISYILTAFPDAKITLKKKGE